MYTPGILCIFLWLAFHLSHLYLWMITFHVYFNADTEFRWIVQHTVVEKCTFSKRKYQLYQNELIRHVSAPCFCWPFESLFIFLTVSKSVWATPLIYSTAISNKYHRLDRCNFNNILKLILLILAPLHSFYPLCIRNSITDQSETSPWLISNAHPKCGLDVSV